MIRFFHVTKRYAENREPALRDVTFAIERGEFAFLTGPSGAGKSTLLRLIFCGERAQEGQIFIDGRNITRLSEREIPLLRRSVGVVFQDFKLLPDRTAAQNVSLALDILGIGRREGERKIRKALSSVGLLHKADALPLTLSGGEQQRVAIARAIVNTPAILLADEPTGNLDSQLTIEVMDLMRELSVQGTTVLVATHDQSLLARYPARVISLKNGCCTEAVTPHRPGA